MVLLTGGCGSKESVSVEKTLLSSNHVLEQRQVEVVEIIPQPITYQLSAVGSFKTPEHVVISPKKAGIIRTIFVREGDRVKRGQALVQLDDTDARLQVERAAARVREAEASLETNRNTLSRYQKLLDSKVIPQQVYDDLSLKVKLDEARLALAKTELDLARQNVLDHHMVSPIDGVVNLKVASLGEHVNVAPKDEILTIVQMDPLELEFFVPESWVGRIQRGSKIHFTVKAFPQENYTASVQFISPTADPATRNVKLKASVPNPHHRLKPGFFAEITLPVGGHSNGIALPESALFSQEGKIFAYVVKEGVAFRREIETGIRFDGKVEVIKGIQKGEQVVTAGHEHLTDGVKVITSTTSPTTNPR